MCKTHVESHRILRVRQPRRLSFFMANFKFERRDVIGGKGQTKTVRKEKSYVGEPEACSGSPNCVCRLFIGYCVCHDRDAGLCNGYFWNC